MKKRSQILESKKVVVNESVNENELEKYLTSEGIYGYTDEIASILNGDPTDEVLAVFDEAANEKGSWLDKNHPSAKTEGDILKLSKQSQLEAYLNWEGILGYTRRIMAFENLNEADETATAIERHPKAEDIFKTLEENPGLSPEEAIRALEEEEIEVEAENIDEAAEMEVEAQLGIALIDIVKNIDPTASAAGNATKTGWEIIQDGGKHTEKLVKRTIEDEIKGAKAKVKIGKIKYVEADSGNISHGTAYWDVTLKGTEEELQKVTGDDKLLYWDWTNEDAFGTGKENDGFSEMTNPNVGYDYGDGVGDAKVVNRIPAISTLPTFEEIENEEETQPVNETDAPQGGFSDAVWRSKSVSNYYEMYGWVYNKSRTDELDRWLEDFLSKQGWDNEEIGAFLVSKSGRILGDTLSGATKEDSSVLKTLTKGMKNVKDVIKKYGIEEFYEQKTVESKTNQKWLEFHVDAIAAGALQKELDAAMWTYEKGVSDKFPAGYLFSIEIWDDEDKESIFNDFINPIKRKGGKIKQA